MSKIECNDHTIIMSKSSGRSVKENIGHDANDPIIATRVKLSYKTNKAIHNIEIESPMVYPRQFVVNSPSNDKSPLPTHGHGSQALGMITVKGSDSPAFKNHKFDLFFPNAPRKGMHGMNNLNSLVRGHDTLDNKVNFDSKNLTFLPLSRISMSGVKVGICKYRNSRWQTIVSWDCR